MRDFRVCRIVVMMASWIAVCWLSWLSPYLSDDFCMMLKMFGECAAEHFPTLSEHFPSFSDFWGIPDFLQTYWMNCQFLYLKWGGRFLAWLITFPLLCLPRWVFAAVNASLWVALSHCVWVACGSRKSTFCLIYFLMFFVALDPEAVLWMSGSFSYLCALAIAGIGLLPYYRANGLGCRWRQASSLCQGAMWALIGFIVVGGHEMVAMTVGICLVLYWISSLRRQGVNGLSDVCRGALTLGCWGGGLACVLAPGNFVRAAVRGSFWGDCPFSLLLRMKAIHFVHLCQDRPFIPIALLLICVFVLSRRLRTRLDCEDGMWACAFGVNLTLTMALTDGIGRTSWFAQVLALVFSVRVLFKDGKWPRLCGAIAWLSAAVALVVVAQTAMTTRFGNEAYAQMMREWRSNPSGVVRGGYLDVCRRSSLDRSLLGLVQWGTGEEYVNQALSKFYGLSRLIVLDEWTYANVWAGDGIVTNRLQRLSVADEWYADPNEDVLVGVCRDSAFVHGQSIVVRPRYRAAGFLNPSRQEKMKENVDMLLRRNVCAWTKGLPRQEIVSGCALRGFVLETSHGKFFVVRHNHAIDRTLIENIQVEVLENGVAK